jgi:hypothetical protein
MAAKKPPVAKGKAVPPKGKPVKEKVVSVMLKLAARDKFKEMIAKKKEAAAKKK